MKFITKKLSLTILCIIMMFFVVGVVDAQDAYTPLASGLPVVQPGQDPTDLQNYLPGVFRLSISIAGVLAFIMITFGGIMYATSDAISGKSQGREYVTNAIWGLLLVLGAWAILNTINPQILRFNLSIQRPGVQAPTPTVTAGIPMTVAQIQEDTSVRAQLLPVTVNNGPCTQGQTTGCTNLNGLPQNTINAIKSLNEDCNCNLMITGGTEGGHKTHGVGKSIVDLRPSSALNSFLGIPNPTNGRTVVKSFDGGRASFTYETVGGNSTGNHWHVVFE